MAHASGILPDKALVDAIALAKEGRKPRFLKVSGLFPFCPLLDKTHRNSMPPW